MQELEGNQSARIAVCDAVPMLAGVSERAKVA
jgi:hypothetical protein